MDTAEVETQVEELVDRELSRLPADELARAREFLVAPRPQERHTRSCRLEPTECWVVAEYADELIAYCTAEKYAADPWLVLDAESEDLGQDERYFPSLRRALIGAGWA